MKFVANVPISITYAAPLPRGGFSLSMGEISRTLVEHKEPENLQLTFKEQVERWKRDTQHWSSVAKMISHPSYLRVIGLARKSTGAEIERLLLQELEAEPDHWFAALSAITGEDPVQPQNDFDESVAAWLEWGKQKGILAIENDRATRT